MDEEEKKLDEDDFAKIAWYAIEEQMRRTQAPQEGEQILTLIPNLDEIVADYHQKYKKQSEDEMNAGAKAGDQWAELRGIANDLRKKATGEEIKEDDQPQAAAAQQQDAPQKISHDEIIAALIADKPWISIQVMEHFTQKIDKQSIYLKSLLSMFSRLLKKDAELKEVMKVFGNEMEIMIAIMTQNSLHPQNSQRTDAIKEGSYNVIDSVEAAREYLSNFCKEQISIKFAQKRQEVDSVFEKIRKSSDLQIMLKAPDVFIAAAAMSNSAFYEGRGTRSDFFNMILNQNPAQLPDIGRKLHLMTQRSYHGLALYNDKMCKPDKVKRQMLFRLWLHLCRRSEVVSLAQMIEF